VTALALPRRRIPVVLPSRRDPRLKLSAVIVSLQILGQAGLGFKVSIAQILVSIAVCAVIDVGVVLKRQGVLAWPASGLLTGNSIGFILRASGTQHGDWWSLHGIHFFVLAAVVAMASKHLIRPGHRHVFNPSNVALVLCLLVIGPAYVFPQYLWWGSMSLPLGLAVAVIAVGAAVILTTVRMIGMALAFLATFAALIAAFALAGRSFVAIWHDGAIAGLDYWLYICTSPELFVFVFFMMSDPQTAPRSTAGRVGYGVATAAVAAALLVVQTTEFGVKLAILAALTLVCAAPVLARFVQGRSWRRPPAAVLAAGLIAATAAVGTISLAGNEQLTYIERGLTGRNPQ
jgi:hypothetical protein